jgi:hypothetical protein
MLYHPLPGRIFQTNSADEQNTPVGQIDSSGLFGNEAALLGWIYAQSSFLQYEDDVISYLADG